jgi:hypothetical protein
MVFIFYLSLLPLRAYDNETPATPPSSLANASRGWVDSHSQSPPPHLPRSQTRAEGGLTHHHHHPTFLTRKREPRVGLQSPPPTLLACKREPRVGYSPPPPPPHLPRSQTRAGGGLLSLTITTTRVHPTFLACKHEPKVGLGC